MLFSIPIRYATPSGRLRCRLSRVCGWSAALVLLAFLTAGPALAQSEEFSFEKLNRTFAAFLTELSTVEIGPAKVKLHSPDHSLTVLSHSVRLVPQAQAFQALLELRFSGRGKVVADVSMGAVQSQLEDELAVPVQSVAIEGTISMARTEGGYLVRVVRLQPSVVVRVESQLARRLFSICRPMALVLVNVDCDALEHALTYLDVPLPGPGEAYLLPNEELSVPERQRLDRFLDTHGR